MELKVRKLGDGYGVLLPQTLLDELALSEGSLVRLEKHEGVSPLNPVDEEFTRQVEAFLQTEPMHRRSYTALAR